MAMSGHPLVRSQIAQRDAFEVDALTAQQQFYPTPSVLLERVNSGVGDAVYGQQGTARIFRLQQPLWSGGRLSAGLDKANALADAAKRSLEETRQQLALKAVQAWADWHLAQLRLKVQQQSVQAHERLMQMVRRRVDEGASAPSELSLTQARMDQAQAQQQSYAAQEAVARVRLTQLIGRSVSVLDKAEVVHAPQICAEADLQDQVLQASAALQKVRAQQQAQLHEILERKGDLMPEVYLRLERSDSPGSFGAGSITNHRVYVGLNSRLGAGLSNLTVLQGLEKRRDALAAEYEATERNVWESVQTEHAQWRALQMRLPQLRSAAIASQQTMQAWDRQFLAGKRSWIEVMNAAREEAQAQIDVADATAGEIGAQWRLAIYCGAVFDDQGEKQ